MRNLRCICVDLAVLMLIFNLMNRKLKLKPNFNKIREIIEQDLKIIPSKFKEELEAFKIPAKGFKNRTISSLITGTTNYQIEKYQDLATVLNKLFEKKKIKNEISPQDLYIDSGSKKNFNVKKTTMVLSKISDAKELPFLNNFHNRSVLFNEFKPVGESIEYIESLMKTFDLKHRVNENSLENDYALQIKQSKYDRDINDIIINLKNLYDIHLYSSNLIIPLLTYTFKYLDFNKHEKHIEVQSIFQLVPIPIFLFCEELHHDPLITYNNAYTFNNEKECEKFVEKNAIKKNIDKQLFLDGNLEEYYKICGDFYDHYAIKFNKFIPFRFLRSGSNFEKFKPINKAKMKAEEADAKAEAEIAFMKEKGLL